MNNKNLLFLIFGLLFYSLLSYSQLPSYVPTNGLVAYWSFNGNANDESGNGNNGTVNGPTQTTDRFGNSNSAYNFDGINDYIMINNVVGNFGVSNFTISVWYNTQNLNQSHLINKRFNESCGNFWELRKEGFEISQDIACIENTSISNTQSIQLNNWYNVIISRNGNVLKYYIDGILSQTTTTSIIHNINNNNNLIIGAVIAPISGLLQVHNGKIDDIGIWNRALTNSEIIQLYNNCTPPSAPIGSSTQTLCSDSTIANLTATGTNIQWYSTSTGGTALASTTALVNGTTYYASQMVSGCESTNRLAVTITLNNPTVSASSTTVCIGQPTTLTATSGASTTSSFSVGSIGPSGGYVFYDQGSVINGWRYLEAAPSNIQNSSWGCVDVNISGATSTAIGNGLSNTNAIITNCLESNIAAKRCLDHSVNGFDDWYLPSQNEFAQIYQNLILNNLGNFNVGPIPTLGTLYWTSTQLTASSGSHFCLECGGNFYQYNKTYELYVRPIRRFTSGLPFSSYLWSTGATTASINVNPTTTTQYWVDITTNGVTCRKFITIFVNSTTPAPMGENNQTMAQGSTLANLVVTGQNILWFSSDWGGTPLPINTPLVNGVTYYASQFINGCEGPRLAVTVQLTLNNNQFNSIQLIYSPNPVMDILNIKASTELKDAKICNLLGQTIFQQKFNSNEILLNMSDVPTGTYFVIVESDDRKETFKILKK